jgi:1,2-diacylglycerol 3-alpha-glucosyltransferase
MHVLLTAGIYSLSGASIVIENLANKLTKKNVEVTIAALKFKRIPPRGAYKIISLPSYNILKLKRFLDYFDVVHNHHPITNYLAMASSRGFIYHYHGAPSLGSSYLYRLNVFFSVKTLNHAFKMVIAASEYGAMELKQYFGLNNIQTIYNGVDTERFKDGLNERFRKGEPQLLFVGNLYPHKNVEELLLALTELLKIYPDAHLQIVGEGRARRKLENLVLKFSLQNHVSFVGYVPYNELPFYYSSCDIYVTSSRCELFPLPLMEAWACGKPVVASRIPAHVELLTKSKAGRSYKLGDIKDLCRTLVIVFNNKDKYKHNAIHFAKQHDWSAVADRVLKIYKRVAR